MDVCPENCLRLVPLRDLNVADDVTARLNAESATYQRDLLHLSAEELPAAEGSVMVKDETICIRCGLCAERCPAHTITMEAFEVFPTDPSLIPVERLMYR